MTSSKWIENISPNAPFSQVAMDTIRPRLRTVEATLRRAARQKQQPVKTVRQLRVATRRAESILDLFTQVLPRRRCRSIKKRLKQIRRMASDARDLDVLCARLQKESDDSQSDPLTHIGFNLQEKRQRAQHLIKCTAKRLKKKAFSQECAAIQNRIHWRGDGEEPSFNQLAVATLRPLVQDFFDLGEADLHLAVNLHELRIAGKRLRYGIELVAAGLPPFVRTDLYPNFSTIQTILGEINDHATAKEMFDNWLVQSHHKPTIRELARLSYKEQLEFKIACQTFFDWWTPSTVEKLSAQFEQALCRKSAPKARNP